MNRRKREGEKSQNKNILYVHMRASGFIYIKKASDEEVFLGGKKNDPKDT